MSTPDERRARALRAIQAADADLRALSLDIHAHPELGFAETHAHDVLTAFLAARRFDVQRGAFGLPTAFAARTGRGGPTIAVFAEFDALPGIGHACGHNLIAITGVAAALGARAALGDDPGVILLLGSPAEEGGGGKIEMMDHDALSGVDAALMIHPAPRDAVQPTIIAIATLQVTFSGKHAHAAAAPWEGLNALDALVLAYNGIAMLRQQLPPDARVHGVITHGGDKPNIIPDRAAAEFYVRAADDARLAPLQERVLACFRGAAEATGCRLEAAWVGHTYSNLVTNAPIAEAFRANAAALGWTLPPLGAPGGFAGSTDMGNVSHAVPAIHPMFAIPAAAGNHTPDFTAAAATPEAHAAALRAATALALTVADLCTDPGLRARARDAFAPVRPARGGDDGAPP